MLAFNADIILEHGFWSREERLNYLRGAKQVNPQVRVILHYLDLSIENLWETIQKETRLSRTS